MLSRWEWGRNAIFATSRAQRPYELRVPLFGIAPGVGRLRAALETQLAAAARGRD